MMKEKILLGITGSIAAYKCAEKQPKEELAYDIKHTILQEVD